MNEERKIEDLKVLDQLVIDIYYRSTKEDKQSNLLYFYSVENLLIRYMQMFVSHYWISRVVKSKEYQDIPSRKIFDGEKLNMTALSFHRKDAINHKRSLIKILLKLENSPKILLANYSRPFININVNKKKFLTLPTFLDLFYNDRSFLEKIPPEYKKQFESYLEEICYWLRFAEILYQKAKEKGAQKRYQRYFDKTKFFDFNMKIPFQYNQEPFFSKTFLTNILI